MNRMLRSIPEAIEPGTTFVARDGQEYEVISVDHEVGSTNELRVQRVDNPDVTGWMSRASIAEICSFARGAMDAQLITALDEIPDPEREALAEGSRIIYGGRTFIVTYRKPDTTSISVMEIDDPTNIGSLDIYDEGIEAVI